MYLKWAFVKIGIPVEILKLNKMAVFAWINLKLKICELYTTKFGKNKKKLKQKIWGAREGSKSKNVKILSKKIKKCDFLKTNAQKMGKTYFFSNKQFSYTEFIGLCTKIKSKMACLD